MKFLKISKFRDELALARYYISTNIFVIMTKVEKDFKIVVDTWVRGWEEGHSYCRVWALSHYIILSSSSNMDSHLITNPNISED